MKKYELFEIDPVVFDNEIDFFPIYNGLKPSSMGLKKLSKFNLSKKEEDKIFLFGESFQSFRKNKENCRNEDLSLYYQSVREYPEIIKYIINVLKEQNSEFFNVTTYGENQENTNVICLLTGDEFCLDKDYNLIQQKTKLDVPFVDAFDAISMNVPEDLVIHHVPKSQLSPFKSQEDKRDFSSKIHLSHCNGWDAKWAISQSFDYIHKGVPRIDKIIPNATRMMLSFLNKDIIYERIAAISFKMNGILNRHEKHESLWKVDFNEENPKMHIRVERQTVTGFPNSEAFLFTIRTYHYDMDVSKSTLSEEIKEKRKNSIISVFENPDEKSYAYNVILKNRDNVLKWLK